MRSSLNLHLIGIFAFISLLSCSHKEVYYEFAEIPQNQWNKNSKICFDLDSLSVIASQTYKVDIEITHNLDYAYKTLWLYLDQNFQDSIVMRDTLECVLTTENGKWKGCGNGPTRQLSVLYKTGINLDPTKQMKICIHHSMQDLHLKGIEKIGLKIH